MIDERQLASSDSVARPFEEQHYPVAYWARALGIQSEDNSGAGSETNTAPEYFGRAHIGRRSKRDYTTIMISASCSSTDLYQTHATGANPLI